MCGQCKPPCLHLGAPPLEEGEQPDKCVRSPPSQVLFAYEEAIGFMMGPMYKDKVGVHASPTLSLASVLARC